MNPFKRLVPVEHFVSKFADSQSNQELLIPYSPLAEATRLQTRPHGATRSVRVRATSPGCTGGFLGV